MITTKKKKEATEEKGESTSVATENEDGVDVETTTPPPPPPKLTKEQIRKEHVMRCNREIASILDKYQCELTAHMIVSDRGNFPEVVTRALPLEDEEG